ncbi:hypothetical protein PHJA_000708600 [Phtheirospermum japonicum]|uniref:Transmembrane protein n=1 Tax=Phtheirospermum japonicum TaxID=374723 RepID=A0A830BJP3_9LAMI|nr:hypothetical protein PHJA_000708600 [Phtheirospermum japonicum]
MQFSAIQNLTITMLINPYRHQLLYTHDKPKMIHAIFTNKNPTSSLFSLSPAHFSKPLNFSLSPPDPKTHSPIPRFLTSQTHIPVPVLKKVPKVNASLDEPYVTPEQSQVNNINSFSFDSFLSVLEFLSLASSAVISVYVALGRKSGTVLVWQCVVLVTGVCVGVVIRRRQWRRVCGFSRGSYYGANLSGRVEKLEEDLRGAATIIRVLSRQIEKLDIRVRAARKALKKPISETAALAQKNSEFTRALAAQEDILENELGEIQKALLAMQEQQQKQLELILAIGKAGKLWETKRVPTKDHNATETSKSSVDGATNLKINEIDTLPLQKQIDERA